MTAFKHPAFAKLSPRIDRAAKEAEHLTVLEPMAQAYTPGRDPAGVDPRELSAGGADPPASTAKHHGTVQAGSAPSAERIPLLGDPRVGGNCLNG
jgi:hypothetical protein